MHRWDVPLCPDSYRLTALRQLDADDHAADLALLRLELAELPPTA